MKNPKDIPPKQHLVEEFNLHYYQLSSRKISRKQDAKKQSKLSKLFSTLTSLDTGFHLSGDRSGSSK